jgi:hypothetical protein
MGWLVFCSSKTKSHQLTGAMAHLTDNVTVGV